MANVSKHELFIEFGASHYEKKIANNQHVDKTLLCLQEWKLSYKGILLQQNVSSKEKTNSYKTQF